MANDATIRMKIVTALDAAGIKATKQQIDGLAKSIGMANAKMGGEFGALEKAMGRLPGRLGKIASQFEGLAGRLSMYAGSFAAGWAIGEKIRDSLAKAWPAYDKLINKTKYFYKEQHNVLKAVEAYAQASSRNADNILSLYDKEASKADALIAKINAEAKAYEAAHRAKLGFLMAGEDVELQRLERERFEDVTRLRAAGDNDAAEQANALYDYYRAELEAKREIMKLDAADAAAGAKRLEVEKNIAAQMEKVESASARVGRIRGLIYDLENQEGDYSGDLTAKQYDKERDRLERKLRQAEANEAKLRQQMELYAAQNLTALDAEDATRARTRAARTDAAYLARDKAALAFDELTAKTGNALGISFDPQYVEQLNQSSIDSYNELAEINERTATATDYLAEIAAAFRGGE